jgi:tRNA threonylcarbamoyladenosine biosynthesis protein TsaE
MLQILYHFLSDSYICGMELLATLNNLEAAAAQFLEIAGDSRVFAMKGNMGAGKTTFITAVCRVLGVTGTIGSPTFSIINEYAAEGSMIFHMDLYRLKDEEEAMQAGVEDALYSGNYCFVEWPEKAPDLFPPGTMYVTIEAVNESTRKLTLASS